MNLIDKIKLRLCGDFLSIASLKMQVEDLELENEELKQKNKTLSNNNNSYSKTWEDMFYKDWAEEIYQSEMKQELMEENTELYSQLQKLAKIHEEYKQETNVTISNLQNKLIENQNFWHNEYSEEQRMHLHYLELCGDKNCKIDDLTNQLENSQKECIDLKNKLLLEDIIDTAVNDSDDKDKKIAELNKRLSEKSKYIIQLKSEKDTLLKKDNSPVKRGDKQYNRFKQAVLKRDNYTCQCCGSTDAPVVHHQFPFATYNHLGADTKNGIVLCKECHQKYHSKYGINGHTNNPVTFAQFLRDEGKVMQSTLEDNSCQPLTFDSLIHKPSPYKQVMDYINNEVE